jgi:hypothetical protein
MNDAGRGWQSFRFCIIHSTTDPRKRTPITFFRRAGPLNPAPPAPPFLFQPPLRSLAPLNITEGSAPAVLSAIVGPGWSLDRRPPRSGSGRHLSRPPGGLPHLPGPFLNPGRSPGSHSTVRWSLKPVPSSPLSQSFLKRIPLSLPLSMVEEKYSCRRLCKDIMNGYAYVWFTSLVPNPQPPLRLIRN